VWGLSYGAFFTLIAVTRILFCSGPAWMSPASLITPCITTILITETGRQGRIGTPEQNPQVYANASPVSHIDALQRPLLILHGTADVNVPFIESVRLG